jgi:DNA-binding NtrC family response regulator
VSWLNPNDIDTDGKPITSAGMQFLRLPRRLQDRLTEFVEEFRYTVMVVDDEPINLELLAAALEDSYRVICFSGGVAALAALEHEEVACIIADQAMPQMSGLEFLTELAKKYPGSQTRKIVLTAHANLDDIQAFVNSCGIFHYMTKPFQLPQMIRIVGSAVEAYAMAVENERLKAELERTNLQLHRENAVLRRRVASMRERPPLIGESEAMAKVMELIRQLAPTDTTVLIRGETGTGKELVARALHNASLRGDKPFVPVNCAALPETLVESELFGHERGAFTDATALRLGRFERANGGTLFIDEVGDLPLGIQIKLLRVLQEGTFERVGGAETITTNVRIISATNRDLESLMDEGSFREDLYYRLNVVPIHLLPLRDRPEDIWPIARYFLRQVQARMGKSAIHLSDSIREALMQHDWPGNVRELSNVIERMVALTSSASMVDCVELGVRRARNASTPANTRVMAGKLKDMLEAYERSLIRNALSGASGNRTRAAEKLGLSRQALSMKATKYHL